MNFGAPFNASGGGGAGAAITWDNTNINVQFTTVSGGVLDNLLSSSGSDASLTLSSWKLVVVAKP